MVHNSQGVCKPKLLYIYLKTACGGIHPVLAEEVGASQLIAPSGAQIQPCCRQMHQAVTVECWQTFAPSPASPLALIQGS